MSAGPATRRAVLLGAGLGAGLALLDGASRGWIGAASALISLVPLATAVALGGPVAGAVAAAVALGGAGAWAGSGGALVVALRHVLPGWALGVTLARRLSLATTLLVVTSASFAALIVLVWGATPSRSSPLAFFERQIAAQVAALEQMPTRFGLAGDPGWAAESARVVASGLRVAGPAVVFVGLLVGVLANYVVARLVLRGRGFRPFAAEAVPDHLVWSVIGGGVLAATGSGAVERVGWNVLIVVAPLYAVQGLAVLRHLFVRTRAPRVLQGVSFALLALQPILLLVVAGLGLSDLWVDYRKIRRAPTPA